MRGISPLRKTGYIRSMIVTLVLCSSVSIALLSFTCQVVRADAPSVSDFSQPTMHAHKLGGSHQTAWPALFVTEHVGGHCMMEEHAVVDDTIAGFRGEYPAWQMNVPLSWYFMEPVYERNATEKTFDSGRVAV